MSYEKITFTVGTNKLKNVSVGYCIGELYKFVSSIDFWIKTFKLQTCDGHDLLNLEKTLEECNIDNNSVIKVIENCEPSLPDYFNPVKHLDGLFIFMDLWNGNYVRMWANENSTIEDLRKVISVCCNDDDYSNVKFKANSIALDGDAEKTLYEYKILNRTCLQVSK